VDGIEINERWQKPLQSDVARVPARLAAGGWPLAKPERTA
jgi:hypothetical protein